MHFNLQGFRLQEPTGRANLFSTRKYRPKVRSGPKNTDFKSLLKLDKTSSAVVVVKVPADEDGEMMSHAVAVCGKSRADQVTGMSTQARSQTQSRNTNTPEVVVAFNSWEDQPVFYCTCVCVSLPYTHTYILLACACAHKMFVLLGALSLTHTRALSLSRSLK